ncbi:MAG: mechanosensitive ion channel [Chitinophagales bacterium]|nr:mechanosensitive ion channel [Chitinophagaceae bacterium]MCB9066031.1 mechanosensitive ion channel [Chitinophagales bacterium]
MNDTLSGIEIEWIHDKLIASGLPVNTAMYLNMLIIGLLTIVVAYLASSISRKILISAFKKVAKKTTTQFDDFLVENHTFRNIARIVPYIIIVSAGPTIFYDFPNWVKPFNTIMNVVFVIIIVNIIRAVVFSIRDFLHTTENFKDKPVQSYAQVVMIFLYMSAGLIIFSILTGKSVVAFLTAMGAASAVLLLVFRDSILGFVASIQVSINDTVRIGDWIEMPKYGADGDVIEINLTTVKVQNWDKTISTIPTYALISDSFKNWRGMQAAGGRRIKRSINVKISSIRHISEQDIERMSKIQYVSKYLNERSAEIKQYNQSNNIDTSLLINGRQLTNLGVFRKYIEEYIKNNPYTHKEMTMLVRHLEPSAKGLPIELYTFANKTEWGNYEAIMADMFDHLLASIRYFDLEVFEDPASGDIRYLKNTEKKTSVE